MTAKLWAKLIRLGQTAPMLASLISLAVIAPVAQTTTPLTLDQVVQKLNSIPVFVVVNDRGQPVITTVKGKSVVGVFISPRDATSFLEDAIKNNRIPKEEQTKVKVTGLPLGDLYRRTKLVGEEAIRIGLVGASSEQAVANAEAKKLDPKAVQFEKTPLYAGKIKGSGYLNFAIDGKAVVPLFFSRAELEAKVAEAEKARPEMKGKIDIELTSLEGIISLLETGDSKHTTTLGFVLLPEVRELMKGAGG